MNPVTRTLEKFPRQSLQQTKFLKIYVPPVASRHTITHEVQNDSLDIRPRERALDLDGLILACWRGRLGRQIGGFKG